MLLALGVVSAPQHAWRREWLRRSIKQFSEAGPRGLLVRFVLGSRGHQLCDELAAESRTHSDMAMVDAHDNRAVGCVAKAFAWYELALRAFPAASFIAKTDDDSFNVWPNLQTVLLRLSREPSAAHAYGGWIQYTSWLPQVA